MQIAKNLLRKSAEEGEDVHLALLAYRNTPGDGLPSPVQMLMGRRTNTTLPTSSSLLQSSGYPVRQELLLERKKELQHRQKQYYDVGSKELSTLQPGERVSYQDGKVWKPAVVIEKDKSPRSYIIEGEGGNRYRRNRRHLQKRPKPKQSQYHDDLEDSETNNAASQG